MLKKRISGSQLKSDEIIEAVKLIMDFMGEQAVNPYVGIAAMKAIIQTFEENGIGVDMTANREAMQ